MNTWTYTAGCVCEQLEKDKNLSYRRETAGRAMSVEILLTTAQL